MEEVSVTGSRHYTISAAARELGKHRHTVATWIRKGFYAATRIGNSVRISEEVLREMAARPDGRPHKQQAGTSVMQEVPKVKISGTYYTMEGAASELGKHRNTVSRWIKEGRLPIIRIGNSALIPEEAIRDLAGQIDVQESGE